MYGEGENRTFQDIIEAGTPRGWKTFDQALLTAYQQGVITDETALMHSAQKNKMTRDIDMLRKTHNKSRADHSGLQMAPKPEPITAETIAALSAQGA